jgi:hypothetical protein
MAAENAACPGSLNIFNLYASISHSLGNSVYNQVAGAFVP